MVVLRSCGGEWSGRFEELWGGGWSGRFEELWGGVEWSF